MIYCFRGERTCSFEDHPVLRYVILFVFYRHGVRWIERPFIFVFRLSAGLDREGVFKHANDYYLNGRTGEALEGYNYLYGRRCKKRYLYYNLGNTYFRWALGMVDSLVRTGIKSPAVLGSAK
jgi:hypothetical protein